MLLPEAMKEGLYHPSCRHGSDTYYREREEFFEEYYKTHKEPETTVNEGKENNEAHIDNMVQKYKRLVTGSVDEDNISKYQILLDEWQGKKAEIVDKSSKNDIIIQKIGVGVSELQDIGKIDIEKYQSITNKNIITDGVVLTDNRRDHIIERRGQEFYDEYRPFFSEILADPDYIFKDSRENTAFVSKCFSCKGTTVNIALKLVVEGDNPNYKNSIITAIKESKKRFEQRLRNNTPIYKKVDKTE